MKTFLAWFKVFWSGEILLQVIWGNSFNFINPHTPAILSFVSVEANLQHTIMCECVFMCVTHKKRSDPKDSVWILRGIKSVLNIYKGFISIWQQMFPYNWDFGESFVIYARNVPQFVSLNIRVRQNFQTDAWNSSVQLTNQ